MTFIRFVVVKLGEVTEVSPAAAGLFRGLDTNPHMRLIGELLCPAEFTFDAVSRARLLEPFLEPGHAFSHHTAAWIHWEQGCPFPICQTSSIRHRKTDKSWHFYTREMISKLCPDLPVPVISKAQTQLDLDKLS
ncbi:hypothetical protein HMPREF0044_1336 [Gleimia coleocanis DSM 15436]|uniref:Uncharacterized protein n=1 Tax=Gleimia coleocanis DSM 15436 TaxID=525245 RepID=C0W1P6_9ACTO|nr:hypothetical protein [Gleimia coleocanis]EEH63412.1 hypothetical protein HMPREF0044_1336 [Gleimia coleocanis DSM 15436]